MAYNTLKLEFEREGALALLTLNRPEKRNAISYELIDELTVALAEVERSEARVLMITGAGNVFCAGLDLDNLKSLIGRSAEQTRADTERIARFFRTLYEYPLPTIAAVNGAAIAGGCGIATLCDITIASTNAKFGYSEVKIGFVPAIVSSFLLRQVGEKIAREMLVSGRNVDAEEAFRIGLINFICAPEQLMEQAHAIAENLLANSPTSMHATKVLLRQYTAEDIDREIAMGLEANARSRMTEDFKEGVRS
ncbi:MAG TPA: enoyl-CoA hydratase-related protein, partial [Terriglobales bacterium]